MFRRKNSKWIHLYVYKHKPPNKINFSKFSDQKNKTNFSQSIGIYYFKHYFIIFIIVKIKNHLNYLLKFSLNHL